MSDTPEVGRRRVELPRRRLEGQRVDVAEESPAVLPVVQGPDLDHGDADSTLVLRREETFSLDSKSRSNVWPNT